MAYKITWSKFAQKQFDNIVSYIENEWSSRISAKFVLKANELFELLKLYPEAGSIEIKEKNIRGFLLTKQVKLFYRLKSSEIILLSFFDTRLNPKKKLKKYK